MCTAVSYRTRDHYFGRTLDYECSYGESVTITPRNYPFHFKKGETRNHHYAMIGMAHVAENYPLYYDAVNEKGLCMAGLNFPENACYFPPQEGKDNVSPFEFIPWILSECASVAEARTLLDRLSLVSIPFGERYPLSPLHWMISDADESVVVEQTKDGLHVYENRVGVLTNNPPFPVQEAWLNNFMGLSNEPAVNRFCPSLPMKTYSRGMGALGLPGDLSSASRFVRAAFVRSNSVAGEDECASVNQFFHILASVAQQRGCVKLGEEYELTIYTSCCNATKGIYYYTTYENSRVTAVELGRENLDGRELSVFPLATKWDVLRQN